MIEIDGVNVEEAAVLRPGDTLVVRVASSYDAKTFHDFTQRAREHMPEGVELLVVACEEIAVARPDAD